MANLLRTEWYKLWHSWYFWGIGIFTFLLSSILLLDSKGKTSNLVMASLYNTPLLYFLIIVFIALFIGNDLGGRTLNAYLTAGHKRGYVFWAKVMVSQIGCILILTVPLLIHEIIGRFGMKEGNTCIFIPCLCITKDKIMLFYAFFFHFIWLFTK